MGKIPPEYTIPPLSTHHYTLSYIPGFIQHPTVLTLASAPTVSHFNLIERDYPSDHESINTLPWARFESYVASINAAARKADRGEKYKVLFLQRHGEGWHNVMEARVGTKLWNVCVSLTLWSTKIDCNPVLLFSPWWLV
jgi:hypothetical protein